MLQGTIIESSLSDKNILTQLQIVRSWNVGDWKLHSVLVDEKIVSTLGRYLNDGPWYMHFYNHTDDVIVVFKKQTFSIKFSQKETWSDAVAYGLSLGISKEQLDFLIE